jgi:serine/threonine-protein kinase
MYYVDGPTLMDVRDDTTLEQKVRLLAQVAEGLHAAHREGLIHRDVKPSNILVEATADGRLKPRVADFGIATDLGGGSSMWSATLAGTPYYIAPERLVDDERPVDRRSDVYSLGVTIYQFLTGELPFHHPRLAEMLRQVREEPPLSMREHAPSLPAELDAVVMKCLAKDPDARYPTARAVANDLWRFLDGEPVEAHTTTFTYRLARTATHGRSLPTGALIVGVLLIAVLAVIAIRTSLEERRLASEAETALEDLAAVYQNLGRFAAAEPLYRRALELRRERLGLEHPRTVELTERLASLYASWDRDGEPAETRTSGEPP